MVSRLEIFRSKRVSYWLLPVWFPGFSRKLLAPGRFGAGYTSATFFPLGSKREAGIWFPGKASRMNPEPAGLARVVAGSKIAVRKVPLSSLGVGTMERLVTP